MSFWHICDMIPQISRPLRNVRKNSTNLNIDDISAEMYIHLVSYVTLEEENKGCFSDFDS